MKKYVILFFGILTIFFQPSCDSKTTGNKDDLQGNNSENAESQGPKKYGIKSGIVHSELKVMGIASSEIFYFDDYGQKECHDINTSMVILGKTYTDKIRRIITDGDVYEISYKDKTYTKNANTAVQAAKAAGFDIENIKKQASENFKLEKLGNEDYLGKPCEKYAMENPSVKLTGTVLTYKNIAMKANVVTMDIPSEITVTKIEEDAQVPDSLFTIPEGMKIK